MGTVTVSFYWVGLLATCLTGQIMRCFLIDTINFEKHFIKSLRVYSPQLAANDMFIIEVFDTPLLAAG
jgi:hypothetical protein